MTGTTLSCENEQRRRAALRGHPNVNGIDYVEVDAADQRLLHVHFMNPLPANAYGLETTNLGKITIEGGTRVVGIEPTAATRKSQYVLDVRVSEAGDFSTYTLEIDLSQLDPLLRRIPISFRASCAVDFDCRRDDACPPPSLAEPDLDYLVKDYAGFRRMLLDLLPRLNPNFVERNPADVGIALVELLAYAGDQLSYFQDAVANEAYLETARRRISVRRHAKLVDYRMHDGRNAWTAVQLLVKPTVTGSVRLDAGTKVLTRISAPLERDRSAPGVALAAERITADALDRDPALASTLVFETTHAVDCAAKNNEIRIHDWGNDECCLAPGATEAFLYAVPDGTSAARPALEAGDLLVLEEAKGPATGIAGDADPTHRQVVVISEEPTDEQDPLFAATLQGGELREWASGAALPLLRVRWRREDALAFPLCLSSRDRHGDVIRNVSVARGNVALADHGLTVDESHTLAEAAQPSFRLRLARGPLTMQCAPERMEYDPDTARPTTERRALDCSPREAMPAVALLVDGADGEGALWLPMQDLLASRPFDEHFVPEVDDDARAILRFGDGEHGRQVNGATSIRAVYRIGNGAIGNVGAEALAHVALPASKDSTWIAAVRNPLPGVGGVDPETIDEVRQRAPRAFRAEQLRAVTEADWADAARKAPDVAGAVARFRWTGSWYTIFVAVDPRDPADLVTDPDGRVGLAPAFERRVRAFLTRFRLTGYDLRMLPPQLVPLEIALDVCAAPGHFRSDVAEAVAEALSSRTLADGRRGFFHPENFTFGQPVYLSRLYAAVRDIEGVDSAAVRIFRRYGRQANGELESGVLPIGSWEIAQLENDPNFMEHGVLALKVLGGKA